MIGFLFEQGFIESKAREFIGIKKKQEKQF